MQSHDPQDVLNLSVQPLEYYFTASNDVFTSNPYLGLATIDPSLTLAPASTPVGGVESLSLMSAAGSPSQTVSHTHARDKASSFSFTGMEKLFYSGTPTCANDSSLYVQIPSSENEGGVSCGSEFWVSIAWDKIVPKLVEYPHILQDLMKSISSKPDLKDKALQMMGGVASIASTDGALRSDGSTDTTTSSLSVPSSATYSSDSSKESLLFSNNDTTTNYEIRLSSNAGYSTLPAANGYLAPPLRSSRTPSFSTQNLPVTPGNGMDPWNFTSAQLGDLSLKLPVMPTPAPGLDDLIKHHLARAPPHSASSSTDFDTSILEGSPDGTGLTVFTARSDTMDPFLLAQHDVIHNENTLEYVWSRSDSTLYKAESLQGQQALTESDSIKFVFPPQTMLLAYEKDGTIATPAYSNLHPHSNEWLKAQVCHRSCPYRAGTASLKRPKTVREHFRKCVYLDEKHPLKVLSALQLAVLEREANGMLPNRRRAKVIRLATESANTLY